MGAGGTAGAGSSMSGPLTVGGVPFLPNSKDLIRGQLPGGKALYVGNRTGTVNGSGKSPNRPLPTLADAFEALNDRQYYGDCIYVLTGHAENVNVADWASAIGSAAGFSLVGLGGMASRPKLTWNAGDATFLLDQAGIEIANFRLYLAGVHEAGDAVTVAAPITISGDECRIVQCGITYGFDANQIVGDGITVTGNHFEFLGNRVLGDVAAVPTNTFMTLNGADDWIIAGNRIEGVTDATTRGLIDTETTACLRGTLAGNTIKNLRASSTIAVSFTSGDTGEAYENRLFVNSGILPFTAGELEWYNNYVTNGEGEAGALVGTASA